MGDSSESPLLLDNGWYLWSDNIGFIELEGKACFPTIPSHHNPQMLDKMAPNLDLD